MHIEITAKGLKITEALREKVEEKFNHRFKRYPQISHVHVILEIHKQNQIVKAHLHIPGKDINATAESKDMYDSIDSVVHKLVAQIDDYKSKITDHHVHEDGEE